MKLLQGWCLAKRPTSGYWRTSPNPCPQRCGLNLFHRSDAGELPVAAWQSVKQSCIALPSLPPSSPSRRQGHCLDAFANFTKNGKIAEVYKWAPLKPLVSSVAVASLVRWWPFLPLSTWAKVITLDQRQIVHLLVCLKVIVAPYDDVDALRQLADRLDDSHLWIWKCRRDGASAVIKTVNFLRTDASHISTNRIFEKDFLSNRLNSVAPPQGRHLALIWKDIDPFLKIRFSRQRQLVTMATVKSSCQLTLIWKGKCRLANSAECVLEEFVNFDTLKFPVIVSGNGKGCGSFQYGKYPPQQHPL